MNNLFSGSWHCDADSPSTYSIQMTRNPSFSGGNPATIADGANIDKFFEDVESIKHELKEVERLHKSLHDTNKSFKTLKGLHNAATIASLRSHMDFDVSLALKKAKLIKFRLESRDRANAAKALPLPSPLNSSASCWSDYQALLNGFGLHPSRFARGGGWIQIMA